jgi:hypothetical protein
MRKEGFMTRKRDLLSFAALASLVACSGSVDPQPTREGDEELAALPVMTVGMTAYDLGYEDPPGRSYTDVIDWNAAHGVNLLRIDGIHGGVWNAARLKKLVAHAHARGMTIALGLGVLSDVASSARARFVDDLASAFCNDTRVFYEGDWETACGECLPKGTCSQKFSAFNAANRELVEAFAAKGCAAPSLAVHVMRNNNYAGTSSGYHASNSCKESFTTVSMINMRGLHEAGKLEGYGVSEAGPAHPLVMETLYEDVSGGLAGSNLDAALWRSEGIYDDLTSDAAYYYRWYAAGVLLIGGAGLVYGMSGASPFGSQRWAWGLPDGGPSVGLASIVGVKTYLAREGYDPFHARPNDGLVDNGFAGGLERAKAATMGGTTFIYNPRHTTLKIADQQGKVAELYVPSSGKSAPSYATIDSAEFALAPPSGAAGDYFLVLRPKAGAPTVTLNVIGDPEKGAYAVEAVVAGSGIEQVDFTVDGAAFHSERVHRYCLFGGDGTCATGTLGRGKHTISAAATNAAGSGSASITLTEDVK